MQEADIEILTRDPNTYIQYTNQPSFTSDGNSVVGASLNATAPVPWTEWAVHRLDWSPNRSTWFVNGVRVAALGYQVPRDGSHVALNAWSNGGMWTGTMEVGKQARMQIKWLEIVFNSTSDYETGNSNSKPVQEIGSNHLSDGRGGEGTQQRRQALQDCLQHRRIRREGACRRAFQLRQQPFSKDCLAERQRCRVYCLGPTADDLVGYCIVTAFCCCGLSLSVTKAQIFTR